jgi:hypothetical protein
MKKGKTSQLKLFSDAKCYYGTVDAKNLKTIYIVLQSWVEPIKEFENWDRATGTMERNIKHILLEVVDPLIFEKHNIVDLDLRSSGIQKGKRSFMNLEITLYLKNHVDFKSPILRDSVKNIISSVYTDCLKGIKYFKVHKSKSTKEVV